MSGRPQEILCRCRGLTRAGVLLAIENGASSVAEAREFCEARGHAVAAAPGAAHDCCMGELAEIFRALASRRR